jgi:hypothetical protein
MTEFYHLPTVLILMLIPFLGDGFKDVDSKDLRNVGSGAYFYTDPSCRNRIHISTEPVLRSESFCVTFVI